MNPLKSIPFEQAVSWTCWTAHSISKCQFVVRGHTVIPRGPLVHWTVSEPMTCFLPTKIIHSAKWRIVPWQNFDPFLKIMHHEKKHKKLEEALLLLKFKGFLSCGLPSYSQLQVPFLPKLLGSRSKTKALCVCDKYLHVSDQYQSPKSSQIVTNCHCPSHRFYFLSFQGYCHCFAHNPLVCGFSRLNFHRGSARRSWAFVLAWETKDSTRPSQVIHQK